MAPSRREFMRLSGLAVAAFTAPRLGRAGSLPDRPVRIVVPFAAGGQTDVLARLVAGGLSDASHARVYVENLPGAGGNRATAAVARALPDGHTVLIHATGFLINPLLYSSVPYDPVRDFEPVTVAATTPNVLVVNPSLPVADLRDLVALLKANPGKHSYAHGSVGSAGHLSGELFKQRFGVDLVTVPFTGNALAVNSTIGGHTTMAFVALPAAMEQVRQGTLRALAVTGAKRSEILPDVPTMAEAGAPDQESETLQFVLVPAKTPDAVVNELYRGIADFIMSPQMRARLITLGFEPVASSPKEFGAQIKAESARWAQLIRETNIPKIE
jgi:tripartite-type tricarboxylate transporter receptor subunit TctC